MAPLLTFYTNQYLARMTKEASLFQGYSFVLCAAGIMDCILIIKEVPTFHVSSMEDSTLDVHLPENMDRVLIKEACH